MMKSNAYNDWAPSCSEAKNEETGENDECLSRVWSCFGIIAVQAEVTNRRENHEAHKHPKGAKDE